MKKFRSGFTWLVAVLVLGPSGMAFAAPCVVLGAAWIITCDSAFLDPTGPGFTGPDIGTLNITNQSGCLFHGNLTVGTTSGGLTGAMDRAAIRITTANAVADGTLIGSNHIELTVSVLAPRRRDVVNTSLCTATRP